MRFLERRDDDFDIVKSFLVVSMIIAHSFQHLYIPVYNKHFTYYVLVGFVFLSGLSVGSIYRGKFLTMPIVTGWAILSRALKLLGIFLFANTMIVLLYPGSLLQISKLGLTDLFVSALLRDGQVRFSFAVLIAISFTFIVSILLLSWRSWLVDILLLGIGISALWFIEITGNFNYYTINMTIVGLIGVLAGKILSWVNWEVIRSNLSKWYFAVWACYITYQAALIALDETWEFQVGHYLNVTIFLLLALYLTSYRFGLIKYRVAGLLNKSLANYMLFAYLFHIIFLRLLATFIGRGNLRYTISVSLFTLAITILAGLSVAALTAKYKTLNRMYSLIFK